MASTRVGGCLVLASSLIFTCRTLVHGSTSTHGAPVIIDYGSKAVNSQQEMRAMTMR